MISWEIIKLEFLVWRQGIIVRRKEKAFARGCYTAGNMCLAYGLYDKALHHFNNAVKYRPINKYKRALRFALTLTDVNTTNHQPPTTN